MITFPFHVVSDPFNKVILNNFLRQKKNLLKESFFLYIACGDKVN
ncbi:hypothetical protein LTSEMIN_4913 [Salmonella enterica subsp. enterica serovar Minnesota str. A4-603]|nr:hypothetical protein LTSEMIN_4913 [Salmonella enterica subsp. enterica serovar Minnesota str. A4-603]